jgi:HKD family nuclease
MEDLNGVLNEKMRSRVIVQGFDENNLEQELNLLLKDPRVSRFRILVAFVTLDGLLKLGTDSDGALFKFANSEDKQFELIVGIDSITTPDAIGEIQRLSTIVKGKYFARAFSSSRRQLFHPKVYICDRKGGNSTVIVGSNNLTPGGLVKNIEVSIILEDVTFAEMHEFDKMWDTFSSHIDIKTIDNTLINNVKERHKAEIQRIKTLIHTKHTKLQKTDVKLIEQEVSILDPTIISPKILVRYIPKAGGRVSQFHFTKKISKEFFELAVEKGRIIRLQQVQPGKNPMPMEERKLVYSPINKNHKIELNGAKILVKNYPIQGRPIVIFEQVDLRFYRYMLLLPNESGYNQLAEKLNAQPKDKSLESWITDLDSLVAIWNEYPH